MKSIKTSSVLLVSFAHIALILVMHSFLTKDAFSIDSDSPSTHEGHMAEMISYILRQPMSIIASRLFPKNSPSFLLAILFLMNSLIWGVGVNIVFHNLRNVFGSWSTKKNIEAQNGRKQ